MILFQILTKQKHNQEQAFVDFLKTLGSLLLEVMSNGYSNKGRSKWTPKL